MAGSINSDSVIWVVGDATGVNGKTGRAGATIPVNEDLTASGVSLAQTQAELDALETRLAASGILTNITF